MTPLHISSVKATSPSCLHLSEALATCLYRPQSHVSREDFNMGHSDQPQPICRLIFIPAVFLFPRLEGSRWELWREVGSQRNPRMGYFLPEQMNQCLEEAWGKPFWRGWRQWKGFDMKKWRPSWLICGQRVPSSVTYLLLDLLLGGHCWGIQDHLPIFPHTFWRSPGFLYSNSLIR